jgi:hypothetical protein
LADVCQGAGSNTAQGRSITIKSAWPSDLKIWPHCWQPGHGKIINLHRYRDLISVAPSPLACSTIFEGSNA